MLSGSLPGSDFGRLREASLLQSGVLLLSFPKARVHPGGAQARLWLCEMTRTVLTNGLSLLGGSAPGQRERLSNGSAAAEGGAAGLRSGWLSGCSYPHPALC